MIVVVRSYNSVWRFARLNTETGVLKRLPLWFTLFRKPARPQGWYKKVRNGLAALYVERGQLWFRLDEQILCIDDHTSVRLERASEVYRLQVGNGDVKIEMEYRPPQLWPPLSEDMTPNIDEEDWDFGLFVYRITTDPERRKRVIEYRVAGT